MEDMRVIELPRIGPEALQDVLAYYALKYQGSYTSEMQKMTEIVDPKTSIKNQEDSDKWKQTLTDKWQLAVKLTQVDLEIL
jgi:hypothetical protein